MQCRYIVFTQSRHRCQQKVLGFVEIGQPEEENRNPKSNATRTRPDRFAADEADFTAG
jgi:hypothetical protein